MAQDLFRAPINPRRFAFARPADHQPERRPRRVPCQQRGEPGTPLEQYTMVDIRREFHKEKSCAPYCTIGCVHRASSIDAVRPSELLRRLRAGLT